MTSKHVADAFQNYSIVPDVIPVAPAKMLQVDFPSCVAANFGEELTPTQVKDTPTLTWSIEPDTLYTLAFFDPDVDRSLDPKSSQWRHWLVTNICGCDIKSGDTISHFISSGPSSGTGLHRYIFLVYKQPNRIVADGSLFASNTKVFGRENWSIQHFVDVHKLGTPFAGNFYRAQWDEYVVQLHRNLFMGAVRSCAIL